MQAFQDLDMARPGVVQSITYSLNEKDKPQKLLGWEGGAGAIFSTRSGLSNLQQAWIGDASIRFDLLETQTCIIHSKPI